MQQTLIPQTTAGLMRVAQAIAKREGFGVAGTVPTRLNNPGDLTYAEQHNALPHGVTGRDGKLRVYAAFPSPMDGWLALYNQIRLDAGRGLSLRAFIKKYAPAADDNDPNSYLAFVMRFIGCQNPETKLAELIAEA
jgi:hypothetical protein